MDRNRALFAVWAVAILASAGLGAQANVKAPPLQFVHLELEDGLSQGQVNAIHQDRHGLMWFGTQDGLNRYDGYRLEVIRYDPSDKEGLTSSFIRAIAENEEGHLWIGTDGGGLNLYNPQRGTFRHFLHDPDDPESLSNDVVRALHVDREGRLWVGTNGGLNRYDAENERFVRYRHDPKRAGSLSSDAVRAILDDGRDGLWIGTDGGGVCRLDLKDESFRRYAASDARHGLRDNRIRSLYQDRWGGLWIGTYRSGLHRYVPEIDGFVVYDLEGGPSGPQGALSSNYVVSLLEDASGNLWVGTDTGLHLWDPARDAFTAYRHVPTRRPSLIDDFVMSLFQDRGGVLWVGTQNGLSRTNLNLGFFGLLRSDSGKIALRNNAVKAIVEDQDGDVWIGTYGGGLHRWEPNRGRIDIYDETPGNDVRIADSRIMSLLVDSRNRLWIGTLDDGLQRLEADRRTVRSWRADRSDPSQLDANGIMTLYEDRQGRIWVGTHRGGLSRYDEMRNRFVTYRHDPSDASSIGSDIVTDVYQDRSGTFWIGTDGAGLNRFDLESGSFERYVADGSEGGLGSNLVFAIHEDTNGDLWIGTQGAGLFRWSARDRRARNASFRAYTSRDLMPNDSIYGIVEDEFAKLWVSSNTGLTKFDPATEEVAHFDVHDGLQSNEFNFGAFHRGSSGRLYFGGNEGLNHFYPTDIRRNTSVPEVRITSIDILNRPIVSDVPLHAIEELDLTHKDDVLTFEFASLDFTNPKQNRYAYMLEGFDDDYVQAGDYRRATYTNLPPGQYTFRVRGTNNDGVWSEEDASIRISVAPPPWATAWAKAGYLLAALMLAFAVWHRYRERLRAEERYSQTLEREVQRRTQELEERNLDLRLANERLEEASLTDSLTGLRNRRYLLSQIPGEVSHVLRGWRGDAPLSHRPSLSFLMIDLDGFKEINDTLGHAAGDEVLLQLRDILTESCRAADYLIRWGGDEFLIVGKDADRENVERLATRLRDAVAGHVFRVARGEVASVSCSIGFARFPFLDQRPEELSWEQVLAIADRALYHAKHEGKNRWVGYSGTPNARRDRIVRRLVDDPDSLAQAGEIVVHTESPGASTTGDGSAQAS